MSKNNIIIKGARLNNLKNISVKIPKNKIVAITGVSGSGKSTLAYDTIYAEAQRRYIQSLSSYARQFLKNHSKPELDSIKGLAPAIAIHQKTNINNPRSTVGTITEIYYYLTLLYEKVGKIISPISGKEVQATSFTSFKKYIHQIKEKTKFLVCCEISNEKIKIFERQGYSRIILNNKITNISKNTSSSKKTRLIIDRLIITKTENFNNTLKEAYYQALKIGNGTFLIYDQNCNLLNTFSKKIILNDSEFPKITKELFNFNNPYGACEKCLGHGDLIDVDIDKIIPNKQLSIIENAIHPWKNGKMEKWKNQLIKIAKINHFPLEKAYSKLTSEEKSIIWDGKDEFKGIIGFFNFLKKKAYKIQYRVMLSRYRSLSTCSKCHGNRLTESTKHIHVHNKNIQEVINYSLTELLDFVHNIKSQDKDEVVSKLTSEMIVRINSIINLGLEHLTLNRKSNSLSGGETQKIHIAKSIGSGLIGSLYILDEPSIGLHPKDTNQLIKILKDLKKMGNSVIIVEHDKQIINASDYIIDIGPLAGVNGGQITYSGKITNHHTESLTLKYINKKSSSLELSQNRNVKDFIKIKGAYENNLKNINVDIPIKSFCAITGVSGSGKTTLLKKVLFPALKRKYKDYSFKNPKIDELCMDMDKIDTISFMDQNSVKKTSKSTPITYIKSFDIIRKLFASQKISKAKKFNMKHFSFNTKGGRCENCKGLGMVTIEMQFLSDITLKCENCKGNRYKDELLKITFQGKTISDILSLTVEEACDFFIKHQEASIANQIKPLMSVGLGYLQLGQSLSTLSSGEAQRIKLASFLSNKTKNSILIFDEPTKGLHFYDIEILIKAFQQLINNDNTIIVIEHNLDIIKNVDWVIDLGPEAGVNGGQVMFSGKISEFIKTKNHTAKALKKEINDI